MGVPGTSLKAGAAGPGATLSSMGPPQQGAKVFMAADTLKMTSPSAPGLTKPLLASHHSYSLAKAGHMAKVRADVGGEVCIRTWIPRGMIHGGCDCNRPLTGHKRNKGSGFHSGGLPNSGVTRILSFLGLVMQERKFSKMSLGVGVSQRTQEPTHLGSLWSNL